MKAIHLAALLTLIGAGALPTTRLAAAAQAPAPSDEPADVDPFESKSKDEAPAPPLRDPHQSLNRAFFAFNDKLYFWVLRPVAQGYKAVVPQTARVGVSNFFSNLGMPVRMTNCLLQGDMKGTGTELARFGVNTTVGILGFRDPAKSWLKLKKRDEDFGQTLAVWGMGPGSYVCIPIIGPSTYRDILGLPVNAVLNPATFLPGANAIHQVNSTSLHLGEYEDLKKSALDPYISVRDVYNQHRAHAILVRN